MKSEKLRNEKLKIKEFGNSGSEPRYCVMKEFVGRVNSWSSAVYVFEEQCFSICLTGVISPIIE